MQHTRSSLADCSVVLEILENPAAAKIDGTSAHRLVLTPEPEHGLVSIMGSDGNFYADAVGTFGVVSADRNWGRLASAAHGWALKLDGGRKSTYYLFFSADAIFLTEKRSLVKFP